MIVVFFAIKLIYYMRLYWIETVGRGKELSRGGKEGLPPLNIWHR